MDLPGLNQYQARINVSCSRTQHSDAGEARTRSPSVSIQALYHWATVLITFANSLDADQARHNVGPDLDLNCLTLWWYDWKYISKKVILKKKIWHDKNNQAHRKLNPLAVRQTSIINRYFLCGTMSRAKSSLFWSVVHYQVTFELNHRRGSETVIRGHVSLRQYPSIDKSSTYVDSETDQGRVDLRTSTTI